MSEKEFIGMAASPAWDGWDEYEEQFIKKGKAGGKGKKARSRYKVGAATAAQVKEDVRRAGIQKRREQAREEIARVVGGFRKFKHADEQSAFVKSYCDWVDGHLVPGEPIEMEKQRDIAVTYSKSRGPGGQNVNKRMTHVEVQHLPTGIRAESQEERSAGDNEFLAKDKLMHALHNHLTSWRKYLDGNTGEAREEIEEVTRSVLTMK